MIYSYSHKPTPRFNFVGRENANNTRTYGLEVEVDQPINGRAVAPTSSATASTT